MAVVSVAAGWGVLVSELVAAGCGGTRRGRGRVVGAHGGRRPTVPTIAVSASTRALTHPTLARLRFILSYLQPPRSSSRVSRQLPPRLGRVPRRWNATTSGAGSRLKHRNRRGVPETRHCGRRARRAVFTPDPGVVAARVRSRNHGDRGVRRMSVRRVMGTETEFGISVPGQPQANPMVASSRVVNAYAGVHAAGPSRALGLRGGVAAARRPRLRHVPPGGRPQPAHRRGPRAGQRDPHQRRPALRRPRPPGVLHARVHQPARHRAVGQGGGAGRARRVPVRRAAPARATSCSTRTTPTTRAPPTAATRTT